jgi:hypothetical protein
MNMMEIFPWLIENCISGTLNGARFYNNLYRRCIVITLTLTVDNLGVFLGR